MVNTHTTVIFKGILALRGGQRDPLIISLDDAWLNSFLMFFLIFV